MVPVTQNFRHAHDLGGATVEGPLEEFVVSEISGEENSPWSCLGLQNSKFYVNFAWLVFALSTKGVFVMRVWLPPPSSQHEGKHLEGAAEVQSLVRFLESKERKCSRTIRLSELPT